MLFDIILEATERYDLDGIQIDEHLTWPASTLGYDEFTKKAFADEHFGQDPPTAASNAGPLELLVLQPTPFCNINCSYCYLPDRQSTRRMSPDTLDRIFAWVFGGEPLTLAYLAGAALILAGLYLVRRGTRATGGG